VRISITLSTKKRLVRSPIDVRTQLKLNSLGLRNVRAIGWEATRIPEENQKFLVVKTDKNAANVEKSAKNAEK
jgi:hypothetical protein